MAVFTHEGRDRGAFQWPNKSNASDEGCRDLRDKKGGAEVGKSLRRLLFWLVLSVTLTVWMLPHIRCGIWFSQIDAQYSDGSFVHSRLRPQDDPLPPTTLHWLVAAYSGKYRIWGVVYNQQIGMGTTPEYHMNRVRNYSFASWLPMVVFLTGYVLIQIPRRIRTWHREDHFLCITCGYPLKSLESDTCPECGREFDPKLLAEGK